MKKFIIRYKETGNILSKFSTKERAEAELNEYLADDRLSKIYDNKIYDSADQYEIIEEDAGMMLRLSIKYKSGQLIEKNVLYVNTANACLYYTEVLHCEDDWYEQIEVPFMQIEEFKVIPVESSI